jgi:hypothetical protein
LAMPATPYCLGSPGRSRSAAGDGDVGATTPPDRPIHPLTNRCPPLTQSLGSAGVLILGNEYLSALDRRGST